jgi:mannose-6-phosphate isomerase-like protein (cupin superfamily)
MINYIKILKIMQSAVLDRKKFDENKILSIGTHTVFERQAKDTRLYVNQSHTYDEWIKNHRNFRSIQVYKMQESKQLWNYFKKIKCWNMDDVIDIFIFHNPINGYSLRKHSDHNNVRLYVVKGYKKLYVGNKIVHLKSGEYIDMPAFVPHKAFSRAGTWALSFGFKKF